MSVITYNTFLFVSQAKKNPPAPTSTHNPNDPFNDDEKERLEVEAMAKKFENKYVRVLY